MESVSDEKLDNLMAWFKYSTNKTIMPDLLNALTELRDRRQASEAPCPEHAKMVAEWDTYEMGRDDSSAAPFWCQLYKGGTLQGQGIGMTMEDAIRQANGNRQAEKKIDKAGA